MTTEGPEHPQPELQHTLADYPGYGEAENRSASDRVVRETLGSALGELQTHVASLQAHVSANGLGADLAESVDALDERIELVRHKIGAPTYAYSPFFTAAWLPVETLQTVGDEDGAIVAGCHAIDKVLEPTLTDTTDFGAVVERLENIVAGLDGAVERRISAIMALQS